MFTKTLFKRLSILGLTGIFVLLISTTTIAASCPEEMTHYWKLDEEDGAPYADSYGTNDATCTNCPKPITGIIGGAQQLDGIIDKINAADDGTWNWSNDASFSIEYWMKTSESILGNTAIVGRILSCNKYWWVGCTSNGTVIFELKDIKGNGTYIGKKGDALNDGNWHLVVAVRDGSAKQNRIYVDGVKIDEKIHNYDADFCYSTDLEIGYLSTCGHYHYNGIVDEVATYDKALTDAEILAHYNSGLTGLAYCEIECQIHEDCNDNNECTDEVCVNHICQYTNNTNPCDDGIFCNGTDTCSGGTCSVHSGNPCPETECNTCQEDTDSCFDPSGILCSDEGNACTDDVCDGFGICSHPNNNATCDDGLFCNGNDICVGGSCSFHSGNPCSETECNTCQEDSDSCFDPQGTTCTDDSNICTDDICDGSGACVHLNNSDPCDDGIFCNGTDTCSGGNCSVHSGNPCFETECNTCQEDIDSCFDPVGTSCTDDSNICTDDVCDGFGKCMHFNNNAPCNDGIFCNGTDICVGGSCSFHSGNPCPETECNTCQEDTDSCFDPAGSSCTDDGNICTDDHCNGGGVCAHLNNTNTCDDGIDCTENDVCSGGKCNGIPNNTFCSDDNVCTDDICIIGGGCINLNNSTPCDDGLFCNGTDTCAGGTCSAHSGNPCPETECNTCQEDIDSCFDPSGTLCSDEGNACTDDVCDGFGICSHPNNNDPCDDGLFCNGTDTCSGGSCSVHSGDPCPDDEGYCTGVEYCDEDQDYCLTTGDPCDPLMCDDVDEVCIDSTVSLIVLDSYGTPGTITISLENLLDEVSEVHFDLCDPEIHEWLHIATGTCELTDRVPQGLDSSCEITDLDPDDGCITVAIIAEIGFFIELGSGPIANLSYTLDPVPPLGEVADLIPNNEDVIDDIGESLNVTPVSGKVGSGCQNDEDCDDYNPCTTDTCDSGSCNNIPVTDGTECNDGLYCTVSDACEDGECDGTAMNCDDGLFCSGKESCDEVNDQCISSGNPCPSPWLCDEKHNACYKTTITMPTSYSVEILPSSETVQSGGTIEFTAVTHHDDGDVVEGNYQWEVASDIGSSIDETTGIYKAGNNYTEFGVIDTIIVTDSAHDDVTNTAEVTVKPEEPPVCEITIEPSSATLGSGRTITLTATVEEEGCLEPDYKWQIGTDIQSEITDDGSTCFYQAGSNETGLLVTDTITVIDDANGTMMDATVTVLYGEILGVFPNVILSSRWIPLPYVMIIIGEDTGFNATSYPTFDPDESIITIGQIGLDNLMCVLLLLSPQAEEGFVDLAVNTINGGGQEVTFTKEDAFQIRQLPITLDERENKP